MALSPIRELVRFGLFELDLEAAQLTRNGAKIRLPQQTFLLLSVLLESSGDIVTREQLRQRLWPSDIFIDFDHGLNKSIQKLRDALGDSAASPRYIETIPRVGYRFIAPVQSGASPLLQIDTEIAPIQVPSPAAAASTGAAVTVHRRWVRLLAAVLAICVATAGALYLSSRSHPAVAKYTQLTEFTDFATTPALSPDGHTLAFIRGGSTFMSAADIYAKILPDGETRLLTHDRRLKYNLAFSPDGSEIAYTVLEESFFSTYIVSVLGGDSHLLLRNAAGLTWLDPQHVLFSRIHSGLHLGVVTSTVTGGDLHELYFPAHERAMAHYSYASPDRKSALVVEMNERGEWDDCRIISIDSTSPPIPVGPHGGCTSAGWSPDGSWMYFVVTVDRQSHIWRQRSPDKPPEQITFGPAEDAGLAVEHDGRSILTSVGTEQSSLWIHDSTGERSLSSEGDVVAYPSPPSFRSDDNTLYYLLRRHTADLYPELWHLTLDTGKAEAVFPGTSMVAYDVSPDSKQVVYASVGRDGSSQLWLSPMDRSSPARQIGHSGETTPYFGPQGQILFRIAEGNANYLEQMNQDGSGRSKVVPYPISEIMGVSPGRKWVMTVTPRSEGDRVVAMVMAVPLSGGSPRRICEGYCYPTWSSTGRFLIVSVEAPSRAGAGRSLVIPVGPGESLPELPAGGIPPGALPGVRSLSRAELVPGADVSHYAYINTTAHRNIYRISLP
jgi:DNA-binding winged helix-turn-helix (wHTH) protein/Tol biopolymer transport system component